MIKQFGGKITKKWIDKYSHSKNWHDGKFQNLVKTEMEFTFRDLPELLRKQFLEREGREPSEPIPIQAFDKETFLNNHGPQLIWYGHSVILLRINQKVILIDPMFGQDAAPIAPFKSKRFSEHSLEIIDTLPYIDIVLMTHDHYDHLDLASFKRLHGKIGNIVVGFGIGRHLVKWGFDEEIITEMDWWDVVTVEGIKIIYTPSRHFSGRGPTDRMRSLWGGWVIQSENENIYFSGDGGYGEHFKEVGEKLGPFNFGMMECGQYNKSWHQIHMYPEESVQAAIDAKVEKAMPVHWAGFALAMHHWKDPIERFAKASKNSNLPIITPQIGESFSYSSHVSKEWWVEHK